jgi:regulator of protease activity HflC (stomatin/prohibitin superfamily)
VATGFEWIGEALTWVADWLPRPRIVCLNEGGVQFWFGSRVRVVKPGWRLDWPAIATLEIIPVARQTLNLEPQTLMTSDSHPVVAGGVVVYRVSDVQRFLVSNVDADDGIAEAARAALRDAITDATLAQIQESDGRKKIDRRLADGAQKLLESFGVSVEYVRLTDFSTAQVLNVVGAPSAPYIPSEDE